MKNKKLLAVCLLLALCFSACGKTVEDPTISPAPVETTEAETTVCAPEPTPDPEASFADNLMKLTAADGNRMISPYSAKMCLALLANGARGETRQQIMDAVGIADLDAYNTEVKTLLERYATYAGIMSLETANSLWLNQTTFGGKGKFISEYQAAMQEYFSAEAREVVRDNSIEEVNAWVNEKTHEKIPEILTEEMRDFAVALVNAVYFKAAWEKAFSEDFTEMRDFNNINGAQKQIGFMQKTDRYGYYEGDGVRAVQIDYGRIASEEQFIRDPRYSFSMYIMLCDDPATELHVDAFLGAHAPFEGQRVHLAIPKFELEYSLELKEILQALGIEDAFDNNKADLGAMIDLSATGGNLFVSDALQKTYIKLDEKGTEAAAVTAIMVKLTSAMKPAEPIEFIADKPFYFAIRDNTNGEILFMGRYETVE